MEAPRKTISSKVLITVIVTLVILLGVTIFFLIKQIEINKQTMSKLELNQKLIEQNNLIYQKNLQVLEDLKKQDENAKVIIITNKEFYENIKKSPRNVSYSSADINKWLKEYESNSKSKRK